MKKLLLLIFICPMLVVAQSRKVPGDLYFGAMLHDFNKAGANFVVSLGINKYLGAGAGVDITSYNKSIFAPAYLDIRAKYPIGAITPFVVGQLGIPIYHRTDGTGIYYTDITGGGRKEIQLKTNGKVLFGGGLGLLYKVGKVGIYVSGTVRSYHFSNETNKINGSEVKYDSDETMGVINLGIIL